MSESYHELERFEKKRATRKRYTIAACIVALLVLVVAGIAIGVTVSNSKKHSSKSSSSTSASDIQPPTAGSPNSNQTTNGNDPSVFTRDPRFHQSFYGIAYTPEGSQLPSCGNSLDNIIKDIQVMSQLTTRVRLYGADCNQTALVLEAIKQTKVNMDVFVGNYVLPSDNTSYDRQRDTIKQAILTYGTDHILGVTVGNEFMLNYLADNSATDPNGSVGQQGAAMLIAYIQDTRSMLSSLSLSKAMPVGNADAGSYFNTQVLSAVDYGLSNVHAWFANTSADNAASWVTSFFEDTNVKPAALLPNNPKMYIAETGWPTNSSDAANASNGPGTASISGLQTFLDTFVCQANAANIPYFFFEFSDEKWKDIQFGGVEGWWGLFNGNRTLKNITLPDCTSP